ncbi:MAG: AsmA-like C-terminal region-containing protein [Desulfarculaceae bacterium]|nr:AsmA-like C-terminal region-containing protein [Desulfarculaceae bacterium]
MIKKILLSLLALVLALALTWAVLGWLNVSVPAGFLRAMVEEDLNQDLAPYRIAFKGPLTITPAWGLDLQAEDIELSDPRVSGGHVLTRVKRLDLYLKLGPLIHGDVDLERIRAHQLRLSVAPGGRGLTFPLVEGHILISQRRYRLNDMLIELGESRLTGSASLTDGKPPRLEVFLDSPRTDLEDVYMVAGLGRPTGAVAVAHSRGQLLEGIDRGVRAAFGAIEGKLVIKARELRLRGANLGRAHVELKLEGNRLTLDPVLIEMPKGSIRLSDEVVMRGSDLASELNLTVRNLNYAMLARHAGGPAAKGGRLSLRISLSAAAPTMRQFMAHAEGLVQVGIWPDDLQEDATSLWAANLVFSLLRSLVMKYESKVNCAIADMVMRKGVLTQRKLIIDTSKVRVSGEAKINFVNRTVDLDLSPRAKTPQFFSLETPIRIQGTFEDFSAGVAPGGLVGSVIQFATSPIFAPLRRLFGDTLPEEGKDVCLTPETWPPPIVEQGRGESKK